MNIRQKRFAELVASGVPAMRAYGDAGYSTKGRNAQSNASALMENHGVKELIAELQLESRKMAKKTKEQKLARLEEIAWDEKAKHSDVIASIRVHNDMTGENQPSKIIVESNICRIEDIRERARYVVSVLCRVPKNYSREQPALSDAPVKPIDEDCGRKSADS